MPNPETTEQLFEEPLALHASRHFDLARAGVHIHPLPLEVGQFVEVVVEQKGIDVGLVLRAPVELRDFAEQSLLHVDSPIGREGFERLVAVAESPGAHHLVVQAAEPGAPAGRYRLELVTRRDSNTADLLRAQAELLFSRGENARRDGTEASRRDALQYYAEALDLFRETDLEERRADTLHRLGWVRSALGERTRAHELFSEAIEHYRQLGERRGEALTLNIRSTSNWDLGDTDAAMADVRAALNVLRDPAAPRLDAPSLVSGVLNNLGMFHRRRNEVEEALTAYREALTLAQSRSDLSQEAQILRNLGRLLTSQGKLDAAEDRLRESKTILQSLDDPRRQATGAILLGHVHKRKAILAPDGDHGRKLHDDAQRAYNEALKAYNEALTAYREAGDRRGEAVALNSLGTVYLLLGQPDASREAFEAAQAIYRDLGNPRGEAQALFNLGRFYQSQNDPAKALALHREASPLLARFDAPQLEGSNRYGLALALRDLDQLADAQREVENLITSVERQREATDRESLRMNFFATKQQYYELAIDVRLRRHATEVGVAQAGGEMARVEGTSEHLEKALALAEKGRARALLDLLGENTAQIRDEAPADLLRREQRIQEELNSVDQRSREAAREAARQAAQANAADLRSFEVEKRKLRDALDEVRAEIRRSNPRAALVRPATVELRQLRRRMTGRNSQWLIYILGETHSYLLLLDPLGRDGSDKRPPVVHRLPGRAELERAALEATDLLTAQRARSAEQRTRHLGSLSRTLLGPVADLLDKQRLVVVAEGALLYLPFAALPKPPADPETRRGSNWTEPGHEMVRAHEMVHLPSASVLLTLRQQLAGRHPAPKQIAIFAAPKYRSNKTSLTLPTELARSAADVQLEELQPLPGTEDEAHAILALTPDGTSPPNPLGHGESRVRAFLGVEANKRNALEGGLADFQILHFATHGLLNRHHPELSGLALSLFDEQERPQDGFLRLHEIYNLRLNAELAVLSACQSGLGKNVRGEGLVGLSRGFMYAGVPRLVVSLWQISDRSTAELMKRFYWSLFEAGAPPSTALRAAQLSMLDAEEAGLSHPYYWSGFIFQGDWRLYVEDDTDDPDDPIETAATGGGDDDDEDVGYPGGPPWCDDPNLKPWQKKVCAILQDLAKGGGR